MVMVASDSSILRNATALPFKEARIEQHPEQPGDVPQTWASVEKAQRLFGYEPKTSFQEGIGRFCDWLVASPP